MRFMPTVALHPLFQLAVGVGSRALWRLVERLALFAVLMLAAAQWAGAQQNGVEFDHASAGFALSGQHRLVRCETCHVKGVFKGTPKAVIDKLTAALQAATKDPDVKSRLGALGALPVTPDKARPDYLRAHLKHEIDTLNPLLIKAGVQPD